MRRHAARFRPLTAGALMVVLCMSTSAWATSGESAAGFSTDARVALRTYAALVEQHLSSTLTGLATVAATEEAASGEWERIKIPLSEVSRRIPTNAAVWFLRSDGSYYTVEHGLTGQNLADRDYFPRLMGGSEVDGALVISKSTGKRSAIVAAPIRTDAGVVGALGASIDLEKLAANVKDTMALPPNMLFYALDSEGRTTLHQDSEKLFEFPSDMGSESLQRAVTRMLENPEGSETYRFHGAKRTVVFEHSDPTQWVFVLGKIGRRG